MERRKLGMTAVWMVCLLGMVAVVWSRPPIGGSRETHPTLALAAPPQLETVETPAVTSQPISAVPQVASLPPQTPILATEHPQTSQVLPQGRWTKEQAPFKFTVEFNGSRMHVFFEGKFDDEQPIRGKLSADYGTTKDSVLFGVVTSAEVWVDLEDPEDHLEVSAFVRQFFDQPFSMRFRFDEDLLVVKDLKVGATLDDPEIVTALPLFIAGCYRQETAQAPAQPDPFK